MPLVAFVYGLAKATRGIQEVLVWFVCCHCHSVIYKDTILVISLEHTAHTGRFVLNIQ